MSTRTDRSQIFNIINPEIVDDCVPDWAIGIASFIDPEGDEAFAYRVINATGSDPTLGAVLRLLKAVVEDLQEYAVEADAEDIGFESED